MKRFKYTKFFGWFAAAALLLTASSCKDEVFGEYGKSDEVTVSFTLAPEGVSAFGTRAENEPNGDDSQKNGHVTYPKEGEYGHISDGSKADILLYALYDKKGELLEGYSNGQIEGYEHGKGQSSMKIEQFPVTVTLTLKRGEEYTIAFWAQSSKTKAYDTKDLRKVEVIYSALATETGKVVPASNNDEYRDAFCRSVTFTAGDNGGLERNVWLYRPLSQINVGTSGFDFETITRNASKKYIYSKIRLNHVARYLDVVKDKVYKSTTEYDEEGGDDVQYEGEGEEEAKYVVDFGYAPIPAYFNSHAEDFANNTVGLYRGPKYPSYTIWDGIYDNEYSYPEGLFQENYKGEEFLKVHLYDSKKDEDGQVFYIDGDEVKYDYDGSSWYTSDKYTDFLKEGQEQSADGYLDYASLSNYGSVEKDYLSETFKYLSMCYVLTATDQNTSDVIDDVKVWMATDAKGSDEIEIVHLTNVPVQRNWRTNIIGNLLTEQNVLSVTLDRNFAGEYNGWGADWNWSGALATGVYYDAKNDEIQISDVDGLLWFQRMVNGDLKVREANSLTDVNAPKVGDYYSYYTSDGDKVEYKYDGYKRTDYNETMQARILKATKQPTWPANNNFHFEGVTVKLMADIDLNGIEWIPIGLDYKVAEFKDNYRNKDTFMPTESANRGFYGTFDGNGHTISNLTTKRFSAKVPDGYVEQAATPRNYDAFPWFGRGLFGAIGGKAVIKDVRLYNVNILGCNGVGGVVGIAYGQDIKIQNCIVDKGELTATPMYRNDKANSRTFARGTYLGGIVGYFNTRKGAVTGCSVRNLTIKGYRQVGGLIGTIDKKYSETIDGKSSQGKDSDSDPASISGNSVSNTVVIASQLHFPFGIAPHTADKKVPTELGFGWDLNVFYDLYSGELIGGDYEDFLSLTNTQYLSDNQKNKITFSELTELATSSTHRESEIKEIPLQYMPALSSWFTDKITLYSNYYGKPSAHKLYNTSEFQVTADGIDEAYTYPMNLPMEVEINWDKKSPNVGLYVESVTLSGEKSAGGRSVITTANVQNEGECCMYVTARDRKNAGSLYKDNFARQTTISNVVLRGDPYAYAGLLLAPNENMSKVELKNVYIYDVYKTIALDDCVGKTNQWPQAISPSGVELELVNSNLRGYTVPGAGWQGITYTKVTFEQGASTGHNATDERTCKVETSTEGTTFEECYFKAPYIIDLKDVDNDLVTFTNCNAAAADKKNVSFDLKGEEELTDIYKDVVKIVIESSPQGKPLVYYYMADDTYYDQKRNHYLTDGTYKDKDGNYYDKNGDLIEDKTED